MRHHVGAIEATDMRSLSRGARHESRVQVIRLRKAGRTYDEIAAHTGLSRTGVFGWGCLLRYISDQIAPVIGPPKPHTTLSAMG